MKLWFKEDAPFNKFMVALFYLLGIGLLAILIWSLLVEAPVTHHQGGEMLIATLRMEV